LFCAKFNYISSQQYKLIYNFYFVADLMTDQLINDDMETANIHNSALKVGCLFACLLQKKGLVKKCLKTY